MDGMESDLTLIVTVIVTVLRIIGGISWCTWLDYFDVPRKKIKSMGGWAGDWRNEWRPIEEQEYGLGLKLGLVSGLGLKLGLELVGL